MGKVSKPVKKAGVATIPGFEGILGAASIGEFFKQPKVPDIQGLTSQAVGAPTIDEAAANVESSDKLRRRRGRLATIATSRTGDMTAYSVGTKKLTGQ